MPETLAVRTDILGHPVQVKLRQLAEVSAEKLSTYPLRSANGVNLQMQGPAGKSALT